MTQTGSLSSTLGTHNPLRYRGYVYDTETQLYYLQSRYYNPEIGRFINADGFVSTGQGLLGYNMFAYCGNNPISNVDPTGMFLERTAGGAGGGLAWAGGSYSSETAHINSADVALELTATATICAGLTIRALQEEKFAIRRQPDTKEVYDYSASLKLEQISPRRNLPQVHHIVPVGQFSSRSFETQQYIAEMHASLKAAGINRFFDPMNLVLVSTATHATLHTDAYIAHVHSYIMAANGSKEGIYAALFFLRIEIAALDIYSMGY